PDQGHEPQDQQADFQSDNHRTLPMIDYTAARRPGLLCTTPCDSVQPPAVGSILPGEQRLSGLNASRNRFMNARSSGANSLAMKSSFSTPMPCSPLTEPPSRMHSSKMSWLASSTRCT